MKQYKIYVVDDDDDDLDILNEAFKKFGCAEEINLFHTVEELMKKLGSSPACLPDLIVLDHQAPGTLGEEAIRLLRTDKKYDSIALVVYSTYVNSTKQAELTRKGADVCLAKGMTVEEVAQHVNAFVEATGKRKQEFPQ